MWEKKGGQGGLVVVGFDFFSRWKVKCGIISVAKRPAHSSLCLRLKESSRPRSYQFVRDHSMPT